MTSRITTPIDDEVMVSMNKRDHTEMDDEDMSSMKKRFNTQICDKSSMKRRLRGRVTFELYSVTISEFKGSHIQGKITLGMPFEAPVVIYDGDEGEIGKPLLLHGTSEPFVAYNPFSMLFEICPKELKIWSKPWFPSFSPEIGVITEVIEMDEWGKVTWTYQMFGNAVKACVNVMFLGIDDDDGKKKYPSRVYGEIYATRDGQIETKVVLFRKSKEEAEPVDNREPIPLSRSVIAADLGEWLQIHVDLWGCYDSSDIRTLFLGCFKVHYHSCTDELDVEPPYSESPM